MAKRAIGSVATSPDALGKHDASPLRRVARALESATRKGESWASGWSTRFPPPAVAFKGDDEHALLLPLRPEDSQVIKKRGVVSQRHEGADVAWEVRGDLVESRNPEWQDFMDERLEMIRTYLGVFDHEQVEMPLRKMVLAETNARLVVEEEDEVLTRPRGAFGTVVVVLPGIFDRGEVRIPIQIEGAPGEKENDDQDDEEDDEVEYWLPGLRMHPYYISWAAFCDNCEYVAEPVQSGSALCLVFDLVTTPSHSDLLRGPHSVQRCVDSGLWDYFQVVPEPLTKRLKISQDAWQTVVGFANDRNFVYIFEGKQYEDRRIRFGDLERDERRVAKTLAAFCAQSDGRYVLYLARVLCSRLGAWPSTSDDPSPEVEDDSMADRFVTLKAPWVKFGDSIPTKFPPVYVDHHRHVVPFGRVERLPLSSYRTSHIDSTDFVIEKHLYGGEHDLLRCDVHETYALVVQPAPVEASQLTRVPIPDAVVILRAKLTESREDALRYARRVVFYRPEWQVDPLPSEGFSDFVQLLVEIDDRQLFIDLLLSLELRHHDKSGALRKAVRHFEWDACEEVIINRLASASNMCCSVNLLVSVINPWDCADRSDKLLDVLLSCPPWTEAKVDRRRRTSRNMPSSEDFRQLLEIVRQICPQKLAPMVSLKDAREVIIVVVPAVESYVEAHSTETQAWRLLLQVQELLKTMWPAIRNVPFADIRINEHCDKCGEIQAFVSSTATEIVVQCTEAGQLEHIRSVIEDSVNRNGRVDIDTIGGTTLRLAKNPTSGNYLESFARSAEKTITDLLARSDRPRLPNLTLEDA